MSLDWLIVGGGIHGVHIAARLIGEADVPPERLRIVDPGERLLAGWRERAATTGMRYLRSPSVHHLDLRPYSLDRFAGNPKERASTLFAAPYDRPAVELFEAHCDHVIDRLGLAELHVRDRVVSCSPSEADVRVTLAGGETLAAGRALLAIGGNQRPSWPNWAPVGEPRVRHVFEPGFDGWPEPGEIVAVVGGGISAVQVALRLGREGHPVHLLSRHPLRIHQFDSEPGWLGPKYLDGFRRQGPDRRRQLIGQARHRGSVPADIAKALGRAVEDGQIGWPQRGVESLRASADGVEVRLDGGPTLRVGRVLLATGFCGSRPGGAMVDELVAAANLPCASCGYPIVDTALRWHPRVHVCGPLAELELGPTSRNIAGARAAGDRLVSALRSNRLRPASWLTGLLARSSA